MISFFTPGALLLPLVSSMLLWENAACVPMCEAVNGRCQLTLEYLFNQACGLSKSTKRLTSEILNEFVSTSLTVGFSHEELSQQYLCGTAAQQRSPVIQTSCNTSSWAQETEPEEWNNLVKSLSLRGKSLSNFFSL